MSKRNRYRAFREKNKRDRTTAHAEWAGKPLEFWGEMARAYNPTLDDETAAKVGDALRSFWLRWTAPTDGRVGECHTAFAWQAKPRVKRAHQTIREKHEPHRSIRNNRRDRVGKVGGVDPNDCAERTYAGNVLCQWFGHKWRLMPGFPSPSGDRIYECGRWNCSGWHG